MRPKLFVLAGAALLAGACSKDVVRPKDPTPVDSPILIALAERMPERSLVLRCRTQREYPCVNYGLETRLVRVPRAFQVEFRDVVAPMICLTSIGPATASLELGLIEAGSVDFFVSSRVGSVTGRLDVTGDAYRVVARPGAVAFDDYELRRIPDGTVWGFFGYARPELEPAVRSILGQMRLAGAEDRLLPEGRYSVLLREYGDTFQARANGTIDYGSNLGYYHTLPFALSFHGDIGALREIVARTGRDYGDQLHLRVFTWQGEGFLSWVLGREPKAGQVADSWTRNTLVASAAPANGPTR